MSQLSHWMISIIESDLLILKIIKYYINVELKTEYTKYSSLILLRLYNKESFSDLKSVEDITLIHLK